MKPLATQAFWQGTVWLAKENNQAGRGRQLAIKSSPALPGHDIGGNRLPAGKRSPLLIWGAGRSQGLTIVDYDLKKKRGRKPKTGGAASPGQKSGASRKPSS